MRSRLTKQPNKPNVLIEFDDNRMEMINTVMTTLPVSWIMRMNAAFYRIIPEIPDEPVWVEIMNELRYKDISR